MKAPNMAIPNPKMARLIFLFLIRFIESASKVNTAQSKKVGIDKLLYQTAKKINDLRRTFTEDYFYNRGLEDDIIQMHKVKKNISLEDSI